MCDDLGKTLEFLDEMGDNSMSKGARLTAKAAESSFIKMGKKVSDLETRVGNVETKLDELKAESRENFAKLESNQANMVVQIQSLADQVKNMSALLLEYAKKDSESDVVEKKKAAQLDLLKMFVKSKIGKAFIGFLLFAVACIGVAGVYVINHSKEVSEIAQAIK